MTEIEGVIKYQLAHTQTPINKRKDLLELDAWRTIMHRLQLIGQLPDRYGGLGYGNISQRLDNEQFIITGTQTGHLAFLSDNDYCIVHKADPFLNRIQSSGVCKPSSEALTHASVYAENPDINYVIHVHCPEIWLNTKILQLPYTSKIIAYGTPEMAAAVQQLIENLPLKQQGIFTMLGHEDGVVAFGKTLRETAEILIACLSQGLVIEQNTKTD